MREFIATVATKGFLVGLVIMPLLILVAVVFIPILFSDEAPRVEGDIAVLDPTGEVLDGVRDFLTPEAIAERREDFQDLMDESTPPELKKLADASGAGDARQQALDAVLGEVPLLDVIELETGTDIEQAKRPLLGGNATDGGLLAVVVVHENAVVRDEGDERWGNYDLFVREKLDDRIENEIQGALRSSIIEARVQRAGMDRDYIEALTRIGRVRSRTVTDQGEKETNELVNILMPAAFMMLLFVSVMTGGQSLMMTTVEEKSSRVAEVLLSAVSPMQLMTGKIIGQMCVGFVIMAVYAGMGIAALVSFALLGVLEISLLFYLVIFYLIAYFFVASLLAAIGAAVNEISEAQNLLGPVMLALMIPWILWMPISRNPESTFSVVASFVPPLNPFVMMIRLASTNPPPWWQTWLSILVGALSVYAAVWFAAKVFRVGLLMYGKPPNFKTLIRWVRMA